jgi:hypothetical protein
MLADLPALLRRVVGIRDLGPDRRLVGPLADPVGRAQPAQAFVRTMPVVVVHPLGQLIGNIRCPGIHRRPELLQHRPLRALDLAIEARRDRAELHRPRHQAALHRLGKELGAAIGLWATRSVVHQVHSLPKPLKRCLRTVQVREPPPSPPVFASSKVSKDRLDLCLHLPAQSVAIPRDGPGLERLAADPRALPPALVVLESTGSFEITVAAALADDSLRVAVGNPRQIRDFAHATGRLATTDRLDVEVIALFAEHNRPEARPIASAEAKALAELAARRRQVIEMLGMEQTRRRQARSASVATLTMAEAQFADLDRDIDDNVHRSPVKRAAEDVLQSVPDTGAIASRTLIA